MLPETNEEPENNPPPQNEEYSLSMTIKIFPILSVALTLLTIHTIRMLDIYTEKLSQTKTRWCIMKSNFRHNNSFTPFVIQKNLIFIYLFRIAILFAAYFFTAKLGFGFAYSAKQITLVWPPAGIALAAMLLWGFSVWPGIFLGALAINFSISGLFLSSFGIAAGNTLAALLGAFLLRRISGFTQSFARASDYVWFIFLGAAVPALVSALLGVSSLAFSHSILTDSWKDFFFFFRTWWFGDVTGVLVFAPIFLIWPHVLGIMRDKSRLPEMLALLSFCTFTSFFVFNPATHYFIAALLPLTLWAIVRFHQTGVVFMTLFLLVVSIFGTVEGFGLFANIGTPEENLLFSQIFLNIISVGSMLIALSIFEGKRSVEQWKKLSLMLHERIAEQSEKLAARAQELEDYLNFMSIFTVKVAPDGSLLRVSKSAEKASGLSREELMKTNFLDGQWWAFNPEVHARVRDAFHRALLGEKIRYDEQILAFGNPIWINLGLIPIPGKDGKTAFIIAEGLNITKRKNLERALTESHHELEKKVEERTDELNNAVTALKEEVSLRDRFLATLSHELRNPLSPIISAVEMIHIMNIKDEDMRKLFEIIERQAKKMAHLLKDLLDISRIAHQKIDLGISPVELKHVMGAAVETARPLFSKREHDLSVSFPEKSVLLDGDALRIEQIIVNLLNNAAKYTPEGGKIFLSGRSENGNAVVTVKDNGIGIPAKMMPKIFTLFSQDEKSLEMAKGGLGIGLALAKALAELHGGGITVSSEGVGKGATFEVFIPLKRVAKGINRMNHT